MTAADVLDRASDLDVALWAGEGGKIRWRCLGGLPVELREMMVAHKAELLSLMTCTTHDRTDETFQNVGNTTAITVHGRLCRTPADLPPEWFERWQERAAIMQYDGGLSPERADALALEDVREQMEHK
jgi:hypothetical protein